MKWMTSLYPHESMVLSSRALVTRLFSTSVSTACRAKHLDKLTLSNQHHSLKPVFITSLPLDCRDSQHRCFWSHETSLRPFSWRVAPRGQACSTLCGPGHPCASLTCVCHPFPVSVGTSTWAALKGEPKPAEPSTEHPASLLAWQPWCLEWFGAPPGAFLMSECPCLGWHL